MDIQVRGIENEEYYLQNGTWEHACRVIPPRAGSIECDVCFTVIFDDFDYSDEYKDCE